MEDRQPILLIGGGGHCKSIIDVIENSDDFMIVGILDKEEKIGQKVLGYTIIDADEAVEERVEDGASFLITVGHIQSSMIRERLYRRVKEAGGKLAVLVSPYAHLSDYAHLGEGTVVLHHALVNAGAHIGSNTIINSKALIEHDVWVGDHCHIATGAILNGDCQVGSHTFIGSRATVIQGITIGEHIMVGAGAVVNKDLTEPGVYAGVPVRKIKD